MTKMRHKTRSNCNIYSGRSKTFAYFSSTGSISCMESIQIKSRVQGQHLLSLQLPQVSHSQLQHVSFLQLGYIFSFVLKSMNHQIFKFIQALVDPCPSLPFQERFHHFPILMSSRHRCLRHFSVDIKIRANIKFFHCRIKVITARFSGLRSIENLELSPDLAPQVSSRANISVRSSCAAELAVNCLSRRGKS